MASCESVPRVWSGFVDAFVDFAVGGHVLTGRATPLRRKVAENAAEVDSCSSNVGAELRIAGASHDAREQDLSSAPSGSHSLEAARCAVSSISSRRGEEVARRHIGGDAAAAAASAASATTSSSSSSSSSRVSFPAVPRLVAIGDVHGDAAKARAALRLAGVMGDGDRWTGGETVLVQVSRGVACSSGG